MPFVVTERSLRPSSPEIIATSFGKSLRAVGSPPVSRIFSMPVEIAIFANRTISSNVMMLSCGIQCGSLGMQ
jgi:hypothetical protein